MIVPYCAHEICVPAAGVPPAEHENAKTRKRENAKTPSTKTRKRENGENGENTIHSVVLWTRTLSQIWACVGMYASSPFRILRTQTLSQLWAGVKSMHRSSPVRSTLNMNVLTALGMCMYRSSPSCSTLNMNVITALGMRKVCTEAVHSVALWTRTLSQLWACVRYVPKQSIP